MLQAVASSGALASGHLMHGVSPFLSGNSRVALLAGCGLLRARFSAAAPEPLLKNEPARASPIASIDDTLIAPHPGLKNTIAGSQSDYMLMHPVYEQEYLLSVKPKHIEPKKVHQKVGYYAVQLARRTFDYASGYGPTMDEKKWLRRFIFLETVAGVPGMVGGMLRHMRSLRSMKRDHGWIHTLLEEAENERMHLLTFLQLRQPGWLLRGAVILAQGVFFNLFLASYLLSPRTCHAFVGYLEEEAVKTYTHALQDLDAGKLPQWTHMPAPPIAISYWKLPADATMRHLLLAVRADEACHMHVNHTFSGMKADQTNPFATGSTHVP